MRAKCLAAFAFGVAFGEDSGEVRLLLLALLPLTLFPTSLSLLGEKHRE